MNQTLNDEGVLLIMTIMQLLGKRVMPHQVQHEYRDALVQLTEARKGPGYPLPEGAG